VGNLSFTIGGTEFTMTPSDYLIPLNLYDDWGLSNSGYYTYLSDGGDETPDCILGMYFLTGFYSVYDTYAISCQIMKQNELYLQP
jgi:hypothetical protein